MLFIPLLQAFPEELIASVNISIFHQWLQQDHFI